MEDNIEESKNAEESDSFSVTVRHFPPTYFQVHPAVPSPPSRVDAPHSVRNRYIVEDDGNIGHTLFAATSSGRTSASTIHACAVRELCWYMYANVPRFMHSMPRHVQHLLDTSIATPKGPVPPAHLYSANYSGIDGDFKRELESEFLDACSLLTIKQRTPDWFFQRQLRITTSIFASMLKQYPRFCTIAHRPHATSYPPSLCDQPSFMVADFYSSKKSSE